MSDNQSLNIDINQVLNLVAEGKITVDQVNYVLNSVARATERVNGNNNGQSTREESSPGTNTSEFH